MSPNILYIDIETSPNLVWTWGLRKQNIGLNQVVEQTRVLCFAAKWGDRVRTQFHAEWDVGDRQGMLESAWAYLDEADVVVSYNGKSFDVPHLHREFLAAGMGPPSPFAEVDLYRVVRAKFRHPSYKLDNITKELDLEGKVSHEGFGLWDKVMAGDVAAQRRMRKYNIRDVTLLEELYEILLPWMPAPPNLHLFDQGGCPRCGSTHTQKRGTVRTKTRAYQQYWCSACGGWFRGTHCTDATRVTV